MRLAIAVALLALVGCREHVERHEAVPVAVVPVASAPAPATHTLSFAAFEGDDLDQCVDMTLEREAPDAGLTGVVRLAETCDPSFRDRQVFATCHAQTKGAALVQHYYRFAPVFESDAEMRECLELGGKWEALSRDSQAFKRAKLRHDVQALQDVSKRL